MDKPKDIKKKAELIKARIKNDRGFLNPAHGLVADRDPDFMEMYHNSFMHVYGPGSVIPRKYKELIAISIDAVLGFDAGLRMHLRGALESGVTEDEILEALEECALVGMRVLTSNMPLVAEEVARYKDKQDKSGV